MGVLQGFVEGSKGVFADAQNSNSNVSHESLKTCAPYV